MILRRAQMGSSAVTLIVLIAVVGSLLVVGYAVFTQRGINSNTPNSQSTNQSDADSIPDAPEIRSTEDLDKASSTIDKIDTDNNTSQQEKDTSQLDEELNSF